MQQFASLQDVNIQRAWLTIGSFDGVHLGHQKILNKLTAGAEKNNAPAVVLTFYPHPALVLRGPRESFYLTNHAEKAQLLEDAGVDVSIVHPFNKALSNLSAFDFVSLLKKQLDFENLLVGHDFALGHNRAGNTVTLKTYGETMGFDIEEIPPVKVNDQIVSSSAIRQLLSQGDILTANELLGHPFSLSGEVIQGDGRGRTIGFPTANISVADEHLVPANGVYVCMVNYDGKSYQAVTNIGVRPTFDTKSSKPIIEAHILDFDTDIYNKNIHLQFIERLRGEQQFTSIDELVAQIQEDITKARKILGNSVVKA
ncbi:MAG: bifunctional riboflavin kinase/FAD synthetase [Chloroflexota bacterium]